MKMIKFKAKVLLAINEMTQKELAEKTGIRPPTVSAICTGAVKHLPIEALNRICAVLNCQPGDLMEYIPDEE
jgi:putative transcriptional regulator